MHAIAMKRWTVRRAGVRPERKRWKLVLATFLGTLLLAAAAGALYERQATRRDERQFPPPGQLVDVGGRRLHLLCIGSGNPVVLFEQAGFANSTSFTTARTAISRHTRVCSYDRMGVGWSDPGPGTISGGLLANDLRRLLDASNIREPIVIVASSIGGVPAELFARRYPERVAGLVFLDAGNSEAVERVRARDLRVLSAITCGAARAASSVGLMRVLDPWDLRNERTEQAARSAALMYGAKPWLMLCGMVRAGLTTLDEFAAVPPLRREIPVTALSAESREALLPPALARMFGTPGGQVEAIRRTHQHLAQGSAHGTWKVVPGSDHLIASSQPQAVVDAVLEMVRLKPDTTGINVSARTGAR